MFKTNNIFFKDSKIDMLKLTIMSFSLQTNYKRLFPTKINANEIQCLHGLRAISLLCIILFHRFIYTSSSPLINLYDVSKVIY